MLEEQNTLGVDIQTLLKTVVKIKRVIFTS